ncbi:SH3 domain-containing protein [Microtetraspora niveoalba]|uniref:SH3 domain-containing protein n=1 Tax=Microtetraspora niveoalba TaxID=46175 RepID=UPI000830CC32|nr:SH3 domain-containing protein [Microtetraspora niveoalba]
MSISKQITPALAVCAAAGWLAVGVAPAQAAAAPAGTAAAHPVRACTYRLAHVRSTSYLRVRRGPGLRFRPIGRLTTAGGRVAGSCTTTKGWVAVQTSTGRSGWAWAHYLRKVAKSQPAAPAAVPSLSCTYQLLHQGSTGSLTVYNGPGSGFQPIGTLNAGGRFAGSCSTADGWVAVKTSTGKVGWTPAQKLRKITGR